MKKLLSFASLAALTSIAAVGCTPAGTDIGVNNPDDDTANYMNATGVLTTRYAAKSPEYIENVFEATKRAFDELKYFRTGETPKADGTKIFARAHGDVQITADITKRVVTTKQGAKQEWIYVAISYGTWGHTKESQVIVSHITDNLFKK